MNYQKIYTDFYSRYYDKTEFLIQRFFVDRKSRNKTFEDAFNVAYHYLNIGFINKHNFNNNEILKQALRIFGNRGRRYEIDQIQEIFANEIKMEFDNIATSQLLPKDYNYIELIKDIAIIEAINEISRLLSNNSRLLEMMYKLNEFKDFEIREYKGIAIDDTPIFKKLHPKLYPQQYTDTTEVTALGATLDIENEINILSLFKNVEVYDCFLEYQKYILEFYTDYSYLKKRMEQEKLIHYHKDNDFMKIIFYDLKLLSEKKYNEYSIIGKLKSITKSYSIQRQNNFNIVFDAVL